MAFLFAGTSAQAVETLRVATFNINYGNVNLDDIVRTVKQADADVICLQETTNTYRNNSEARLKIHFRQTHPHIHFVGHKGKYSAERFGILSKFPLSKMQFVPPVHGLFGTCFAALKLKSGEMNLVNVHLSPFQVARGSNAVRAFRAISAVETRHKLEIDAISKKLKPDDVPTLVCGDFNSMSTFVAPTTLTKLGLRDSFADVTGNADSHPTWRWPVGKMQIQFRIDYVFHSRHFQTATSKVLPTVGSDHSLLVSELTFQP